MKRMGWPGFLWMMLWLLVQAAPAGWTTSRRLTANSGRSWDPAVAVDASGHIHAVWDDDTPGNREIYYMRSQDGGETWAPAKRLTWTSGSSEFPAVAADTAGSLHVVWHDDTSGSRELYYKRSADGGDTWGPIRKLTWNSGGVFVPAIAADAAGHLHMTWMGGASGNAEIFYKKSTDGGATWTTSQRLTWNSGRSEFPSIATGSSGNIHIIWHDDTAGSYQIYHKRSTDGGSVWGGSQRLTWISGLSAYPAICTASSADVHVVWENHASGNSEIYHKKSSTEGTTWEPAQKLTSTSGVSMCAAIAAEGTAGIHVVWQDNTVGNFEVYYEKSSDGGATWQRIQRLTKNSGSSGTPVIAVDSLAHLHVLWADDTPGNFEIYYKTYAE